ncbi:MAG: RNA polymerase sigma factor [Gemmatales bacterium]
MSENNFAQICQAIDQAYRSESRRAFATLVRLIGDFDLAEESLSEAFTAALESWQRDGIPANPRAWLVSTARYKAIDAIRRRTRHDAALSEVASRLEATASSNAEKANQYIDDDRLRLIFTCCHPALSLDTQVALTLREVCGLTTEEIASAFLTAPTTIAQRIVRGKGKIRSAGIPYEVPSIADVPVRLESVLSVIYLVFNEGYSASSGESLTRPALSDEAIRLGRLLVELLPDTEAIGLLALMLLTESRRPARTTDNGDLILLEDQDRSLWNRQQMTEGTSLVQRALDSRRFGVFTIQAAIASVHAAATTGSDTNWGQIVSWYDMLLLADPSPVIKLNRAVAISMRDGPEAGLQLVDALLNQGELADYFLAHAAKANMYRLLGNYADARAAYERALELTKQEPQRRFLAGRLQELE